MKKSFQPKILMIPSAAGFTLIEVLVALLIFTIGLLGLASLQVISYRLSSDSLLRSTAAILANDMIDRMRVNAEAAALGVTSPYNNPSGAATGNPACLGKNAGGGFVNTQCTSTQMAQHDFFEWNASIRGSAATAWYPAVTATLPSGVGVVCIDSTPMDGTATAPACDNVITVPGKPIYAIKLWWVERKNDQVAGVTHQFVTSFAL